MHAAPNLIYNSGTSGAVWAIGGAFCKAKAWMEGMETEAGTLKYVQKRFDIPVPEIVYDWQYSPALMCCRITSNSITRFAPTPRRAR